tara:strand:- start:575 stop:1228 length:654 start_codon:yes stop_codon:yes gene_type:complete
MSIRGTGINKIAFIQQIVGSNKMRNMKFLREMARKRANLVVKLKRNQYITEFLDHEITKDIKAGPRSESGNSSGALGSSKGNLYSFIGFQQGMDPTGAIRDGIEQGCRLKSSTFRARSTFRGKTFSQWSIEYDMAYPTVDDLKRLKEADMPWEGGSWIDKVEKNISGLGAYFFARSGFVKSKSGNAIQLRQDFQSVKFKRTDYFTGIIRRVFGKAKL